MNSSIVNNILRFLIVIIVQITIFQHAFVEWTVGKYVYIFFYTLFILLLPIRTPPIAVIILAFILGIIIDISANSLGIHTSAIVFTAFLRPYVLNYLEPRKRYDVLAVPSSKAFGLAWFAQYSAILIFCHCLFYFSVDAFTFKYIIDIIIKTIICSIGTLVCIIICQLIFDPKH